MDLGSVLLALVSLLQVALQQAKGLEPKTLLQVVHQKEERRLKEAREDALGNDDQEILMWRCTI
jgi:hypothetical protein